MGGSNGTKQYIIDNDLAQRIKLSDINGIVAIDASCFIYRAKHNFGNKWWLEMFNFLQKFNFKILFVFDGKPDNSKLECIKKRKEKQDKNEEKNEEKNESSLDNIDIMDNMDNNTNSSNNIKNSINIKDIKKCKNICKLLGIPYIHIESLEADDIFPYLINSGFVDGVFSQDNDMIRRGCKIIYCDMDYNENTILEIKYDLCLQSMGVTSVQFNNAYDASGTDYNDNITYCKFKVNIELMKQYNTIENVIANLDIINQGKTSRIIKVPKNLDFAKTRENFDRKLSEKVTNEIDIQVRNFHLRLNNTKFSILEFSKQIFDEITNITSSNTKESFKYIKKVKEYYNNIFDICL